jgi:hypothetical protein
MRHTATAALQELQARVATEQTRLDGLVADVGETEHTSSLQNASAATDFFNIRQTASWSSARASSSEGRRDSRPCRKGRFDTGDVTPIQPRRPGTKKR